ncbi:MAG: hypothetical protein OHK005_11440 [Candidatus Methylacidiphilales bacterium]
MSELSEGAGAGRLDLPGRGILAALGRWVYEVDAVGAEVVNSVSGAVLVSNHVTYMDALVLQLACPRPIRFMVDESSCRGWINRWLVKTFGAIPLDLKRPDRGVAAACEAVRRGELVCLFPEGQVERTATLLRLSETYRKVAEGAEVPVIPVWLESLWGSIFSYSGLKVLWKWPARVPYRAQVWFGEAIPAQHAAPDRVRSRIYDLGAEAFAARPEFGEHLALACVRGLWQKQFETLITDAFQDGKKISGGMLLAAGLGLSRWLKDHVPERRVGIVLPPGLGAVVANLACVLADKVPVNLNFTAGPAAVRACLAKAEISTVLTADAVVGKLGSEFPWPPRRWDLPTVLKGLNQAGILAWRALFLVCPPRAFARLMGLPLSGGDREAGLLFTSGSSGEPKGVLLTHRNLLANVEQCRMALPREGLDLLVGCLPIFHSFGFTVTLWWPLISGPRLVTYVSPLDAGRIVELIEKFRPALLFTTPTFLRAYLRKGTRAQMTSLKMIVTGAEKLPPALMDEVESKWGVPVCEGYGMTEGSPVISVNQLDLTEDAAVLPGFPTRRQGSVGRLVPGLTVRVRDPETAEDLSLFKSGMLWFKGANIFPGYLGAPDQTASVLVDGWYQSGDIGRLDEDGFLYIEGRLSRFSKLGGEMVPHGTVEAHLIEAFATGQEGPCLVVTASHDPVKGETLVVLTTLDLEWAQVRDELNRRGLPNLWVPRVIKKVEAIPVLGSGKLDLKQCEKLASME